jgi:hypothetical protein
MKFDGKKGPLKQGSDHYNFLGFNKLFRDISLPNLTKLLQKGVDSFAEKQARVLLFSQKLRNF